MWYSESVLKREPGWKCLWRKTSTISSIYNLTSSLPAAEKIWSLAVLLQAGFTVFLWKRWDTSYWSKRLLGRVRAAGRLFWYIRILLQKLTVAQLIKIFPAIYETWRLITMLIRGRYWSLNTTHASHPISLKIHFNIIKPSTRDIPSVRSLYVLLTTVSYRT